MNTPLNISTLQTFDDAVTAYEQISAKQEKTDDPVHQKNLSVQLNQLLRHISDTFKTRRAHSFLWETIPDGSPLAKQIAGFYYKRRDEE